MAITYDIYPALRIVVVRFHGLATIEMTVDALLGYLADPGFNPEYHILGDQSGGEIPYDGYSRVMKLASSLQPLYAARASTSRTSLYCPAEDMFAIARVFGSVSETWTDRQIGIFRTKEEALRFAYLDPDDRSVTSTIWPHAAGEW